LDFRNLCGAARISKVGQGRVSDNTWWHSLDSQEVCEAVKERAQYLHRFVDVVVPRSCCMFTVANSGIELRRGKRNRIHIN
jgi:hypothetical protein